MTYLEILSNLCYYDERNPDNVIDEDMPEHIILKGKCYCDNCFSGKTKLAEELVKYIKPDTGKQ